MILACLSSLLQLETKLSIKRLVNAFLTSPDHLTSCHFAVGKPAPIFSAEAITNAACLLDETGTAETAHLRRANPPAVNSFT